MRIGPLRILWRRNRPYHEARTCWTALNPAARNALVDAVVTAAGEDREGPLGTTTQDLESAIELSKRTASAEYARTRTTVNIYGIPTDNAAAIGDAVRWVAHGTIRQAEDAARESARQLAAEIMEQIERLRKMLDDDGTAGASA